MKINRKKSTKRVMFDDAKNVTIPDNNNGGGGGGDGDKLAN
jgi:hypothetical protein